MRYKYLVTGAAGFIGSNICKQLLKKGNKVVGLDNFATGFKKNISLLQQNPDFTFIEGDIRNYDICRKIVDGVSYVLHQAALGSVPRSIADPMTSNDTNVGGFVNMLHAAKEAEVKRFVFASSSSVYGDSRILPKVEYNIGTPLSPYAITKYTNEIYAKNFSKLYGIETIGLRYFNVFGPNQDPNGAYAAVIPKWVKLLLAHQQPVINGDPEYSRDFTYVKNVIHANIKSATQPTAAIKKGQIKYYQQQGLQFEEGQTIAEVLNIAYGGRISLDELFKALKEALSKYDSEIAHINYRLGDFRAGDIPHSNADISKAKMLIDYYPEYDVETGLKNACQWYFENIK